MKKTTTILTVLSVLAAGGLANAQVSGTIAQVETNPSGTTGVTITSDPIVTAILCVPGATVNGYTYSTNSGTFLIADSSGSMEVYKIPAATYTPTVGDALSLTGEYDPFDAIPEITSVTSVSKISGGNSSPTVSPVTATVSAINTGTIPSNLAGQMLELNNVTITGMTAGETFGTANIALTVTDATGTEELFYYPHDFSLANLNLFGETIPTGPVDIEGIAAIYPTGSVPEFYPMNITAAPEPSSIALATLSGGAMFAFLRRRK